MDPLLAVIYTRAAERIIAVLAGILAIWVGYRLFALVPDRKEGQGKLSLPGGFEFIASRIGPGIFFALFGAGLIAYSVTKPVSFSQPAEVLADAGSGPVGQSVTFSSIGQRGGTGPGGPAALPRGSLPRETVIGTLDDWAAVEQPGIAAGLRVDRALALREAKLAMLREVWDENAWGPYDAFHRWIAVAAGTGTPPAGSEQAVALYGRTGP
jgi:hypothetical protein